MSAYALKYEIVEKNYSAFLFIPKEDDDESGEPFIMDELKLLWSNQSDSIIQMILIICQSGYRITAYTDIKTNPKAESFKGGVKTKSSKERIVPIHPAICQMVSSRYDHTRNLLGYYVPVFRRAMYDKLETLGIAYNANGKKHTPHDCRHTFSYLCEKYGVNENDRRRMLGHSFGSDITNAKYGHRTIEELRLEIEKIQMP